MPPCRIEWEDLLDYYEARLPEDAAQALRLHLETCSGCRARQEEINRLLAPLSGPPLDHAPRRAQERVRRAFRDRIPPTSPLFTQRELEECRCLALRSADALLLPVDWAEQEAEREA